MRSDRSYPFVGSADRSWSTMSSSVPGNSDALSRATGTPFTSWTSEEDGVLPLACQVVGRNASELRQGGLGEDCLLRLLLLERERLGLESRQDANAERDVAFAHPDERGLVVGIDLVERFVADSGDGLDFDRGDRGLLRDFKSPG